MDLESLGEAYAPAIALDGWNYIRYLGPFTTPPPEPVFLCAMEDELVVAPRREPSKLWCVVRLGAPEDDVNRHACALKREGTQTFIGYQITPSEAKGEVALGPQMRLDVFRVTRMKSPSHIRVYQAPPSEECCDPEGDDAQTQIEDPNENNDDGQEEEGTNAEEGEAKLEPPPAIEWYLGISSDLKVVIKPFPPMSECSDEMAKQRPVWEFTSRDEAIRQDYPSLWKSTPIPSQAHNPLSREFYILSPDRLKRTRRGTSPRKDRRN